ncbi:MAG: LUD domain-containing protein [Gammaproteobacteria bacterium]
MSSARDDILERVRRTTREPERATDVPAREALHPHWDGPLLDRFAGRLEAAAGTLARATTAAGVVKEIRRYLAGREAATDPVLAPHPLLERLPWPDDFKVLRRPFEAHDRVAISVAFAGIAETGSLVLGSSRQTPTLLNFLPDIYLCVIDAERVVPYMEDAFRLMLEEQGAFPRSLNLITGPSRTADVEQTIQLGAHGPRNVHVILWEEQP